MKYLLAILLTMPSTAFAQQSNYYDTCFRTQETYVPGYQDQNGNWVNGSVNVNRFPVPCGNNTGVVNSRPTYYRQRVCNPTAGALLGAGLAGALSGNSWSNGGSWNRTWSRNSSSGSWNNYGRNNYWPLFGAGLGALAFSC
jgi:hypothetical protein